MRLLLAALLIGTPAAAIAATYQQTQSAPIAQTERAARNLADFDFVTSKIAANYAGWENKVTAETKPRLDALTAQLRTRLPAASDEELLAILTEWLGFFKDRHTGISAIATTAPAPVAERTEDYPTLPWTEATVRSRLAQLGAKRDPVEGIWSIGGGRYRVGVLRTEAEPDKFVAVVLTTTAENWKPGQIKAEMTKTAPGRVSMIFRPGDHSQRPAGGELVADGSALMVPQWGMWSREWPKPADPNAPARIYPVDELFLRRHSAKTLWLRIPDFSGSRAKPLKELLDAYQAEIASSPNLIIDLRNNGGGSDYVYGPLVPLLYTRPIITIGVELRATADNIALREEVADRLKPDAPDQAARLQAQNELLRQRLRQYVPTNPRPFSIERHDKVLPFPKRVAILIDGAGSTGEQFLLLARQSRKVTLFGQKNSAGVLDFANVVGMPTPSGRYRLRWAMSRSLRLPGDPVDPHGMEPDIRIPEQVRDPVRYAADWLERQVD
jgi:hypothetical protein